MDHPAVGRRLATTVMMATIAACLTVAALWPATAIAGSMVGTFMATGAFNIVYVQVPELYPTAVRNSALGLCSAFARITSIAATILPAALGSTPTLALIAACCCAAACCSWLLVPETVGRGLPDRLPGAPPPRCELDERDGEVLAQLRV
eukprot:1420279-Prymnesium_polylepis.1